MFAIEQETVSYNNSLSLILNNVTYGDQFMSCLSVQLSVCLLIWWSHFTINLKATTGKIYTVYNLCLTQCGFELKKNSVFSLDRFILVEGGVLCNKYQSETETLQQTSRDRLIESVTCV